ncbi:MAG: cysteine desulfurase family protein [Gemmatimonadota bacterium]
MNASPMYLDYAATAPLRDEVWEAMARARRKCGNPASAHGFGRDAHRHLEEARETLSGLLGCAPGESLFTGGGTQSDNLAILGFVRARAGRRPRVLLSAIEHKACLGAAERAEAEGATVRLLPVDSEGTVELEALADELRADADRPTLVSILWANNEVGSVQPVARAAALAHEHGALFHTDAVQAFGKIPVSLETVPADLLTVTAHKLGGPVGIGLLVRRRDTELEPLAYGGSQERSLWPGTQNPVGAVGFAEAARLAVEEREAVAPAWRAMRDQMAAALRKAIPGLRVHAEHAPERLPNLLSVGIPECDTGSLLVSLDLEGVAASAGSACSSGSSKGSHVLEAMGIGGTGEYATLRFSFGHDTTAEQVAHATAVTADAASRLAGSAV